MQDRGRHPTRLLAGSFPLPGSTKSVTSDGAHNFMRALFVRFFPEQVALWQIELKNYLSRPDDFGTIGYRNFGVWLSE